MGKPRAAHKSKWRRTNLFGHCESSSTRPYMSGEIPSRMSRIQFVSGSRPECRGSHPMSSGGNSSRKSSVRVLDGEGAILEP